MLTRLTAEISNHQFRSEVISTQSNDQTVILSWYVADWSKEYHFFFRLLLRFQGYAHFALMWLNCYSDLIYYSYFFNFLSNWCTFYGWPVLVLRNITITGSRPPCQKLEFWLQQTTDGRSEQYVTTRTAEPTLWIIKQGENCLRHFFKVIR